MLHCMFDGGIDIAYMMAIDCSLEDLSPQAKQRFVSWMKNENTEVWDAYVEQKKKWV